MTNPLDTVIAEIDKCAECIGYLTNARDNCFNDDRKADYQQRIDHYENNRKKAYETLKQLRVADGCEESYLIWSNEHVAWWAAGSRGYCLSLESAGRYSKEEAIKICNGANYDWREDSNPNELPIPESIGRAAKK